MKDSVISLLTVMSITVASLAVSLKLTTRSKRIVVALLSGLSLPAAVFSAPHHFSRPVGSDLQRMRGDTSRIGGDFKKVISREHGRQKIARQTRNTSGDGKASR